MKIARLKIFNFRGIKRARLYFGGHSVLVGDNNVGKSTILEAIDLVLGPERLSKVVVIDEHDFFAGDYIGDDENPIVIEIEVIITDLNAAQLRHFRNNIEWWDTDKGRLIKEPPANQTDKENVLPALRVCFRGYYDSEEDDFIGRTFYCSPENENGDLASFTTKDKRLCGFIYLRTIRTGNRALSLERGSLLDIILKLKDIRPQMWEDILEKLRSVTVADKPELGITDILQDIQIALGKIVPTEWIKNPRLQVSDLTREHLRRILTVFIETGAVSRTGNQYSAPFNHQGSGTINALVLVLLSMIAELKQNVIFAMEEPEIAIPPCTQKRIINSIMEKSSQAIFTSHSPYVLEEFEPSNILVISRDDKGSLKGISARYPVKQKLYRDEFRKKLCEGLLARRVLIVEGRTEYDSYSLCSKKLHAIKPDEYKSFDALGLAIVNAETDSQMVDLGNFFNSLGKEVYAICDKQKDENITKIQKAVDHCFESPEKGFEDLLLKNVPISILRKYASSLVEDNNWPSHYKTNPVKVDDDDEFKSVLGRFLKDKKGSGEAAVLLSMCQEDEMPDFIQKTLKYIKKAIEG